MNLNTGDVGFTKKFVARNANSFLEFGAEKGKEFITLLLGVKEIKETITPEYCEELLGSIGWVSSDRIISILGEEAWEELKGVLSSEFSKRAMKESH